MSSQPSAGTAHAARPTSGGDHHHEQRALAPIRWPKPDKGTIASLALWFVGLLVGVLVPALLVPPEVGSAAEPVSGARVAVAMAFTVGGALIMTVSAYALHRKTRSIGAAILAFVPTFVIVVSGCILATMKLVA